MASSGETSIYVLPKRQPRYVNNDINFQHRMTSETLKPLSTWYRNEHIVAAA